MFDFLKKRTKEEDKELDIPPPPPAMKRDMPKEQESISPGDVAPKMPAPPAKELATDLPSFKFNEPGIPSEPKKHDTEIKKAIMPEKKLQVPHSEFPKMPTFPSLKEEKEFKMPSTALKKEFDVPIISKPKKSAIKEKQGMSGFKNSFIDKEEKRIYEEEKDMITGGKAHRDSKKPIFIKLGRYKEILGSLNGINVDAKKSDEILFNSVQSKEDRDKSFQKWHDIMTDCQNKLIFIEKSLFKGDYKWSKKEKHQYLLK